MRRWLLLALVGCADPATTVGIPSLQSAVQGPGGPKWVAVDDTLTTWPNWTTASEVVANDTGLVDVVSAFGGSPYHARFVLVRPLTRSTVIPYTAVDATGRHSRSADLSVTLAPVPPATDLQVTGVAWTTPGRLWVELKATNHGALAPAYALQSSPLNGLTFLSKVNDRCVSDLPPGKVTCARPALGTGAVVMDTLRFSGTGFVQVTFFILQPNPDTNQSNQSATVTAIVP